MLRITLTATYYSEVHDRKSIWAPWSKTPWGCFCGSRHQEYHADADRQDDNVALVRCPLQLRFDCVPTCTLSYLYRESVVGGYKGGESSVKIVPTTEGSPQISPHFLSCSAYRRDARSPDPRILSWVDIVCFWPEEEAWRLCQLQQARGYKSQASRSFCPGTSCRPTYSCSRLLSQYFYLHLGSIHTCRLASSRWKT